MGVQFFFSEEYTMKLLCLTIILFSSLVICKAQNSTPEILTNKMVVELVKAKFAADTIIKKIQTASAVNFDTSTSALIELKNSGVEETIIQAMLDRSSLNASVASGTPIRVSGEDGVSRRTRLMNSTDSKEKEQSKKFSLKKLFFTFDLTGCKGVGETIQCELLVTNNDKDMKRELIYPYGSTPSMYDEKGKLIYAATKTIAGHTHGREVLSDGVPVSITVAFQGLKNLPASIKLITLPFSTPSLTRDGWGRLHEDSFLVEFRDVPVTQ